MTDDIETLRHTIYYVFGVERRNEAIAALERVAQSLDHYEREYLILQDRAESAEAERDALEATLRKAQEALSLIECVYRKNCVAVGEPSTVLDALRATIAEIEKVLK